jgi:putative DNA methylase
MRKKMIEVAIPLDAINRESAREKNIRHGHPSTLHLWWARRPLAACRSVLFASLVDDPDSDPANLNEDGTVNQKLAQARRATLFKLLEDLATWENLSDGSLLSRAQSEIASCIASAKLYDSGEWRPDDVICGAPAEVFSKREATPEQVKALLAAHGPPVLDPFAGGGGIPLEGHRLGLRVHASDLNPVPVVINKALIETPPLFSGIAAVNPASRDSRSRVAKVRQKTLSERSWVGAQGLAEDIRFYGKWMRDEAETRLRHLYPKVRISPAMVAGRKELEHTVGTHATVIAWLWSRTVQCPNPSCRARAPLVRSFWLSKKKGKQCFAKPIVDEKQKTVRFDISSSGDAPAHTTDRTGARCLFCGTFIKKPQLREIATQYGVEPIPLAIAAEGERGRFYLAGDAIKLPPVERPLVPFLEQPITNDRRWFSPPLYGLTKFADLFTTRQLLLLTTLSELVSAARARVFEDAKASLGVSDDRALSDDGLGARAYADAIALYLAIGVNKVSDYNSVLVSWINQRDQARSTFSKQALPMIWDFCEVNPFAEAAGDLLISLANIARVTESAPCGVRGAVKQMDITAPNDLPPHSLVSTDPPYYDNIGYSDLSDFFYILLRQSVGGFMPSLFSTVLTPKAAELIASSHRHDGDKSRAKEFFEDGFRKAFAHMRRCQTTDAPLTVYYAFKQSETDDDDSDDDSEEEDTGSTGTTTASTGWETMLSGLVHSGFCVTATWPMRTERSARTVGLGTNALASSIVLACRVRASDAPIVTRRDLVSALRKELPAALRSLQAGNIAPVDLAQAAIGPGMAVYSRYSKVLESSGERLSVRTALALINQVLDEVLAEQEGDYDADTRWSLKWFEQFAHDEGPFNDANTCATAMNIGINGLVETGIVQAKAGKVRLLKRTELMNGRPETWDPATDTDIVHWEVCQYLIHALDTKGEAGASALLRRINARYPGAAETARELAYRLYTICERKKWAQEAMAYNSLIVAWPEIVKLAQSSDGSGSEAQTTMF